MSAEIVHAHEWDAEGLQNFVGLAVGRDEIFHYQFRDDTNNIGWRESGFDTEDVVRTYEYNSSIPGRVAYGVNSGAVYIRDLSSNAAPLVFKQRATRKCNAVSFNSELILASAYEKTRGLESLLLWDVNTPSSTPLSSAPVHDTVMAAKFVPTDPSSILLGCARALREYDVRSNTLTQSVSTSMYIPMAFNPFNDLQFATHGETNHVALWDRRMLKGSGRHTEPLLVIPRAFKEQQKLDARCFRFSLLNNHEVSVLNDGAMIRRWDISAMSTRTSSTAQYSQLTSGLSQTADGAVDVEDDMTSLSGASDSGIETNTEVAAEFDEDAYEFLNTSLFVNKVFEVPTENDKVVSFDYTANGSGALEFVCLRQSGTVFRMHVRAPPLDIYFDPFNDFRMVSDVDEELMETTRSDHSKFSITNLLHLTTRSVQAEGDLSARASVVTSQPPASPSASPELSENSEESETETGSDITHFTMDNKLSLPVLLSNDITSLMQRRALAGYSLDAAKNIELLSSPKLNQTTAGNNSTVSTSLLAAWRFVHEQQKLSDNSRSYWQTPELDLRFIGVYALWNGTPEALIPRLSPGTKFSNRTLSDSVRHALKKSSGSVYVKEEDDKAPYRQLCLRLAGWDFGLSDLESRIEDLESKQMYEKAAGWAVFHNNVERAVEVLANSRKRNLRLMSTAIAGYLVYKNVSQNNVWREQCRRLASELDAPYLRAIFAYISDGSWLDVLDDGSLPLTERLGIAFRFLPAKEVGKYLSLVTSRAIANGDLEGIILTGFTPKILDLLRQYLDRSGDIQTACLLVSFGWPRYFDDPRFNSWFSEYRQLLNSWKYFRQRASLDIARSRLQKPKKVIQSQVFLRCNNCKRDLSSSQEQRTKGPLLAGRQLRNRCLYCNAPLPPCGVCTLALGSCVDDQIESDRWPTFCLRCNHGFHSVHARQWFSKYDVCPMPSCSCKCGKTV